jgi:hypothetical protein
VKRRFSFSQTRIENLPLPSSPGTRAYYYDSVRSYLCLCVTNAGTKTFYLYRKISGRPERIRIGRYPGTTIDVARTQADKLNGQVAADANPQALRRALRAELTLGELFDEYKDKHLKVRSKRLRGPIALYETHLSRWATRPLSSITKIDVQRLHSQIGGKGYPVVANRACQLSADFKVVVA